MATHKMGGDSVVTNTLEVEFTDGTIQTTAADPAGSAAAAQAAAEAFSTAAIAAALPKVVFTSLLTGKTTPSYPVGLVSFTTSAAGYYRISGEVYGTTLNSGAWAINLMATFSNSGQAGSNFIQIAACQLQAGNAGITPGVPVLCYLNSGVIITFNTITGSGTESGGVYSVVSTVEQLA